MNQKNGPSECWYSRFAFWDPQVEVVSSPEGTPAMSSWKVCAVSGHWQVALSLYSEMCEVRQDLPPNALTLPDVYSWDMFRSVEYVCFTALSLSMSPIYCMLISSLASQETWKTFAEVLFCSVMDHHVRFTSLFSSLGNSKEWPAACALMDGLRSKNHNINTITWLLGIFDCTPPM